MPRKRARCVPLRPPQRRSANSLRPSCSLPDSTPFPVQLRHSSSKNRPPGQRSPHGGEVHVTPIARELLAPSLPACAPRRPPPAEAYTAGSVFRWEREHFFDRGWVCAGRADGPEYAGDQGVVEWQGWLFANASGDAPQFEEHAGNLEDLVRNYGCEELVVATRHDYKIAANWKILVENYHECYHCSSIHPELCKVSPPKSGGDNLEPEGAWIGGPMDLYTREAVEQPGFDPSFASDFWDITNRQDWHACEAVQRGVSSRGYRRGPLSPREDAVYQFITMVANGYLQGKVSRPASRVPAGAIRESPLHKTLWPESRTASTPSTLRGSRELTL